MIASIGVALYGVLALLDVDPVVVLVQGALSLSDVLRYRSADVNGTREHIPVSDVGLKPLQV